MKEKQKQQFIPSSELIKDAIYFNSDKELIQIKKIDNDTQELALYNITNHYSTYFVKFENHNLIKRVR